MHVVVHVAPAAPGARRIEGIDGIRQVFVPVPGVECVPHGRVHRGAHDLGMQPSSLPPSFSVPLQYRINHGIRSGIDPTTNG